MDHVAPCNSYHANGESGKIYSIGCNPKGKHIPLIFELPEGEYLLFDKNYIFISNRNVTRGYNGITTTTSYAFSTSAKNEVLRRDVITAWMKFYWNTWWGFIVAPAIDVMTGNAVTWGTPTVMTG